MLTLLGCQATPVTEELCLFLISLLTHLRKITSFIKKPLGPDLNLNFNFKEEVEGQSYSCHFTK